MKSMTPQAKIGTALMAFVLALAIFGSAFVYTQALKAKESAATSSSVPKATARPAPYR